MRHAEFAELAAKRLESMADRLEEQSKTLGVDQETLARAQELRVAAFIVRDQAVVRQAVEGLLASSNAPPSRQGAR